MTVYYVSHNIHRAWDHYVDSCTGAVPFHLSGWREVMNATYGYRSWHLAAIDSNRFRGLLSLYYIPSPLLGAHLTSLPGGICTDNSEAAQSLLEEAHALIRQTRAKALILRDTRRAWGASPAWHDDCTTAVIELPESSEEYLRRVKRQTRQNICRAAQTGVHTLCGPQHIEEFYRCFSKLLHEKGVPVFSRDFLRAVTDHLPGRYVFVIAHCSHCPVGAMFLLRMKDCLYAIWGGALAAGRETCAAYSLWWGAIHYAIEEGFPRLDMGRSPCGSGVEEFKRRWGSVTYPVYRYSFAPGGGHLYDPLEDERQNIPYRLFTGAWRRLPEPLATALGPAVRRHIPFG